MNANQRLLLYFGKKKEIPHHNLKEHFEMTETAKYGL